MLVRIEADAGVSTTAVLEAGDLRRLTVQQSSGVSTADAGTALAQDGLGYLSDGFAWLSVDALRTAATDAQAGGAEFAAMLAYAADHGWLSDDGRHVRAHCEVDG